MKYLDTQGNQKFYYHDGNYIVILFDEFISPSTSGQFVGQRWIPSKSPTGRDINSLRPHHDSLPSGIYPIIKGDKYFKMVYEEIMSETQKLENLEEKK